MIQQWKNNLRILESKKEWDNAIEFMQRAIEQNPHDVDMYIVMNYLLMNLLVEEDYDKSKRNYYCELTYYYFQESYAQFSNNPEYLFYTGITTHMSEWYFRIDCGKAKEMLKKAVTLEPTNPLYKWGYYVYLDMSNMNNWRIALPYAQEILSLNSIYKQQLQSKGAIGDYILEIMTNWYHDLIIDKDKEVL